MAPPGFRDAGYNKGYGRLWLVGNGGFCWSSSDPSGSGNAHYLNFTTGGLDPQYLTIRAGGFPLRCLQEERAAPAPGYRDAMSARGFGGLRDVGNYGYSWSSTIPAESGNAHYLDFNYDGVYPQRSNYRAYGLQLRCLQEKGGGRAADFTLEPDGLSVRENLLRLACGAVELWGLNESLSSSPLRPRWPLLSVMRQKVGKERSQGDCHPLG